MTNKKEWIIDIPNYYKGKVYKYEARKIIEDFDLNYNIGSTVSYLLRANNKHECPENCIRKAINHLHFELDKMHNQKNIKKSKTITGGKL